jgi:predicted acetyltransferase
VPVDVGFIDESQLEAHIRAVAAGFHDEVSDEKVARLAQVIDSGRAINARDGKAVVGTCSSVPFELKVPGGAVPAAGVTAVTVRATHRRQGLLRRMMRLQLENLHERGEPAAILWASEGGIYPRFGYGLASLNARLDAERARMALRDGEAAGTFRPLALEEAREVLPQIYDRVRRERPGFFSRSATWWESRSLSDEPEMRRGAGPLFCAVLDLDGSPAGYALYRFKHIWESGVPKGELHVQEAVGVSALAHREVWRFLFGVDLVGRIRARLFAIDDPLRLLVSEPSALGISVGDGLYLRLVDVAAALAARGYAEDGSLAVEIVDDFCPWNAGVWHVEAAGGRAEVRRGDAEADLRLTATDLASAYLGGFSFAALRAALRLEERSPGAVERADALFRTERAPFGPETF